MKTVIIAAATGLVLCSTACSSSKGGTGSFNVAPPHGSVAVGGKTSTGAPATSTAPVLGGGGNSAAAWCAELDKDGPAVITAGDPNSLPPDWQAKADQLAADAPDDIRPDVETVIKTDEAIINGNANADSTPAFLTAGEHLVKWLGTNCPGLLQKYNPGMPVGSSTNG